MADLVPEFGKSEPRTREPVSLKSFFLLCILWLPFWFFVWFALRSPITFATRKVSEWMLNWWQPGLIFETKQRFHHWIVSAYVPPPPGVEVPAGQLAIADIDVNVLLYTYGLAVFWGLMFASPSEEFSLAQKLRDSFIGWLLLLPLHAFGCVMHVALNVFVVLGEQSVVYAAERGVSPTFVAYFYQFSSLVMPTLSGLIMWAIFQRNFLRDLQGDRWMETNFGSSGPKPGSQGET